MSIKRIDLIIDTDLTEEQIRELVKSQMGDLILYSIENLKAKTKEDAIEHMTGF